MDRRLKRVFVIVLDSMGMGAMADAARFGDEGADTLGHISQTVEHFLYSKPGIFRAGKPEILKTGTAAGTSTWILCGTE